VRLHLRERVEQLEVVRSLRNLRCRSRARLEVLLDKECGGDGAGKALYEAEAQNGPISIHVYLVVRLSYRGQRK
jgi:hypothetical protein